MRAGGSAKAGPDPRKAASTSRAPRTTRDIRRPRDFDADDMRRMYSPAPGRACNSIGGVITIDRPYTGHVSPGENPQQRDLDGARIVKMSVGPMDNNVYLVQCAATGAAVLIDAANEPERILELVEQEMPGKRSEERRVGKGARSWSYA